MPSWVNPDSATPELCLRSPPEPCCRPPPLGGSKRRPFRPMQPAVAAPAAALSLVARAPLVRAPLVRAPLVRPPPMQPAATRVASPAAAPPLVGRAPLARPPLAGPRGRAAGLNDTAGGTAPLATRSGDTGGEGMRESCSGWLAGVRVGVTARESVCERSSGASAQASCLGAQEAAGRSVVVPAVAARKPFKCPRRALPP